MKVLLDSHVVFWAIYEPLNLSPQASSALVDSTNELFISHATVWELANKAGAYRLPQVGSVRQMHGRIQDLPATFISISLTDILDAATLPRHHGDPFDRMLIAQARTRNLVLLSADADVARYDVSVLW